MRELVKSGQLSGFDCNLESDGRNLRIKNRKIRTTVDIVDNSQATCPQYPQLQQQDSKIWNQIDECPQFGVHAKFCSLRLRSGRQHLRWLLLWCM